MKLRELIRMLGDRKEWDMVDDAEDLCYASFMDLEVHFCTGPGQDANLLSMYQSGDAGDLNIDIGDEGEAPNDDNKTESETGRLGFPWPGPFGEGEWAPKAS